MRSDNLIRWSGPVLLLSGILIAVGTLTHPNDVADPGAVVTARWVLAHSLYLVGALLSLFGLVGLYARQAEQVGWVGLVGFVLAFMSSALFIAAFTIESFVVPALAADVSAGALLDPAGPLFGGPLGLIFLLVALGFAVGQMLLGFATARAGVLPRSAGVLLLVGAPLLALWPPLPYLVGMVGGAVVGLSYAWLGSAIWAGSRAPVSRPQSAAARA